MKKIIFALFAMAVLTLTGCESNMISIMELDAYEFDNTTEYCWHAIQTDEFGVEKVYYIWATEQGLILHLQGLAQPAVAIGQEVKSCYSKTSIGDPNACNEKMFGAL